MLPRRLQPRILQPQYVLRVLVLRLMLFGLAAYSLDTCLHALVDQSEGPHVSWGWRVRLGLLGYALPLVLNAAVFIQAIRDMPSFEQHYTGWHRAVVAGSVLGKVLELVSRMTTSSGGAQHAMLMHAMLFVVHQDPDHLLCLAAMTAAYSAAQVWSQPGLLLQHPVPALAAGAAAAAAGTSSMSAYKSMSGAILGLTTGGEFFVNVFFAALALQRVYSHYMGPPEPAGKRQLVLGPSAVSGARRRSALGPDGAKGSGHLVQGSGGGHGDSAGNGLQRSYLLKLALVKVSNAFFVALYALQTAQQHLLPLLVAAGILDGRESDSADSDSSSWFALLAAGALTPALAGLACAFMLLCHAMCGFVYPAWFKRHSTLVNSLSLYTCMTARLYLMIFHTQRHSSSGNSCQGLWKCVGVAPEHAFHSFLVLASSLAVHEDPAPWFGAQLLGMATLYRWVHLQLMAVQQPGRQAAGGLAALLQLPEYWVVAAAAVACYKWYCVGRESEAAGPTRQLQKQPTVHWQRQRSSRATLDEQSAAGSNSAAPSRQGSASDSDSVGAAAPARGLIHNRSLGRSQSSGGGVTDQGASAELRNFQRMACAATSGLLSLAPIFAVCPRILAAALRPDDGVDLLARVLGGTGATIYMVLQLCFAYLMVFKPRYSLARRELLWSINFGAPCVQRVMQTMMRVPARWPPRRSLLVLASGMGLLDIPGPWFAAWLPVVSITLFSMHAWLKWEDAAIASLALEVVDFNLVPIIIYTVTRWVTCHLHCLVVSGVLHLARRLGAQNAANRNKYWVAACTCLLHVALSGTVMKVLLKGPLQMPAGLNPFELLDAGKLCLLGMLQRMNLLTVTRMEGMSTVLALLGLGASFLAVSSLQALILSNPLFHNPRQAWYEAAKGRVAGLGERTLRRLAEQEEVGAGADEEALVIADLRAIAGECLPGCTLLLTLFEELSLESDSARRYLVQSGPGAGDLPTEETLLLSEMPSVVRACEQARPLYRSGLQPAALKYPDLQRFATSCGLDTFLVVPLAYAHQDMGALLVAARAPISLDWHSRQLAADMGAALSQALYTLSCVQQMRAGDQIIHDVLPQKVAEHLKRRMIHDKLRSSSAPESPHASPAASSPHHPLLHKLSEAASALKAQQQLLLQKHQGNAKGPPALDSPGQGVDSFRVPVVYRQWHPEVTVLFADISSYTSLSTQVEPEQVMLMLHELFSKYDHLCTRYGIYKVETIGDCYMACTGVLVDDADHAQHMVQFAKAMLGAAASVRNPLGGSVHIRVGVHSGRVMSGIVGSIRARYCLFGDTVNTASRMESTGVVDRIQVSEDTYRLLGDLQQDFELREAVSVKGKGVMQTYVLREEVAEQVAADSAAELCNAAHS